MAKKNSKLITIVLILVLITSWALWKRHQFSKNYKICIGNINRITTPGWKQSGDYTILYEFKVEGKTYNGTTNRNFCGNLDMDKVRSLLVNKSFPIAYLPGDCETCTLILNNDDARRFNYHLSEDLNKYDSILTCQMQY